MSGNVRAIRLTFWAAALTVLTLGGACQAACKAFNGDPERRLIVILDKSGSMQEEEKSAEIACPEPHTDRNGRRICRRIDFARWDIKQQVGEELKRGTERLKIFIITFDSKPTVYPAITGSAQSIANRVRDVLDLNEPGDFTDIAGAFKRAEGLFRQKDFDLKDGTEIKILYYSDGEQDWPVDRTRSWEENVARYQSTWNSSVEKSLRDLGQSARTLRETRFPNLAISTHVRYWGESPIARLNLGNDVRENLDIRESKMNENELRARLTLSGVDITRQARTEDHAFLIDGQVSASGNNISSARLSVSLDPPLAEPIEADFVAGADLKFPRFHFKIPAERLAGFTDVKVVACLIQDPVADRPRRPVDVTNSTVSSLPITVGELAKLECISPPGGRFESGFRNLGAGLPERATMRLRWNAAATKIPLTYSATFPNFKIDVLRINERGQLNALPNPFTLDDLNKNEQSGELTLSVTATQPGDYVGLSLLQISGPGIEPLTIKADVGVSLPIVRITPMNQDKIGYDSDNLTMDVPVAVLIPEAGASGHHINLDVTCKKVLPDLTATLAAEGMTNGTVPDRSARLILHLQMKNTDVLKKLEPGDFELHAVSKESGLRVEPELTRLNITFQAMPRMDIVAFDSTAPFKTSVRKRMKRGDEEQWHLEFSWNDAASGKKVGLPFPAKEALKIGNGILEISPVDRADFDLSGQQHKPLYLKVRAIGQGVLEHPELPFRLDETRKSPDLPEIEVFAPAISADFIPTPPPLLKWGEDTDFGKLSLSGDKDAAGEGYKITLTAPAGCKARLELGNRAPWLEVDGSDGEKSASKRYTFESPVQPLTMTLRAIVFQKYFDLHQAQSGLGWPHPKLDIVRVELDRETSVVPMPESKIRDVQLPRFQLALAEKEVVERSMSKGTPLLLKHIFVDASTLRKLPAAFYQPGGGVDGLELVIEPSDPDFTVTFQATGTPRMSLSSLKDGAPVPILATYKGPEAVVSQLTKLLSLNASIKSSDGHIPAMTIDVGAFKFHLSPMIPPLLIGLAALLLVIGVIVVVVMKNGATSAPPPPPAVVETPQTETISDVPPSALTPEPPTVSEPPAAAEPPAPDSGASDHDWESRNQF